MRSAAVVGFVALKQGEAADGDSLRAWCTDQGLPSIKVPEAIRVLDSLPKNLVGKIAKRELRDTLWQGERKV